MCASPFFRRERRRMPHTIICETCGAHLQVPNKLRGSTVYCPTCTSPLAVPKKDDWLPDVVAERKMSTFKVMCPSCNDEFDANRTYIGRRVKCPNCKSPVVIPDPNAPA